MSDLAVFVAVVAAGIANGFLFVFMDKWIVSKGDAIATGTFDGAEAPLKHRLYRLQLNVVANTGTLIFILGLLAAAWALIGRNASADIKWYAYLSAFGNGMGAIGWLVTLPFDYRHLASILRQAEAD
jgi:hypothetical protein